MTSVSPCQGCILKSNIVNPGKKCPVAYSVTDIAQANLDIFKRCMPVAIRSANYLSGGQSLEDASARLSVMNQLKVRFRSQLLIVSTSQSYSPGGVFDAFA